LVYTGLRRKKRAFQARISTRSSALLNAEITPIVKTIYAHLHLQRLVAMALSRNLGDCHPERAPQFFSVSNTLWREGEGSR
jgi:hypothetical protein